MAQINTQLEQKNEGIQRQLGEQESNDKSNQQQLTNFSRQNNNLVEELNKMTDENKKLKKAMKD